MTVFIDLIIELIADRREKRKLRAFYAEQAREALAREYANQYCDPLQPLPGRSAIGLYPQDYVLEKPLPPNVIRFPGKKRSPR